MASRPLVRKVVAALAICKYAKYSIPRRFWNPSFFGAEPSHLGTLSSKVIARNRSALKDLCKAAGKQVIVDGARLIFGRRGGFQQNLELADLIWSG